MHTGNTSYPPANNKQANASPTLIAKMKKENWEKNLKAKTITADNVIRASEKQLKDAAEKLAAKDVEVERLKSLLAASKNGDIAKLLSDAEAKIAEQNKVIDDFVK